MELRDNGNNGLVFDIGKVECDTFSESERGKRLFEDVVMDMEVISNGGLRVRVSFVACVMHHGSNGFGRRMGCET